MSSQTTGITGRHLVRYGTPADQKYLLGPFRDTYDQLVVNANMLAHAPLAIAGFLSREAKKPFIIDPNTHAFQHGRDFLLSESKASDGKVKKSWQKLIDAYGGPFAEAIHVAERSILPNDFKSDVSIETICAGVADFQLKTINSYLTDKKDAKYLKFVSKAKGIRLDVCTPSLIVAPYFYLGDKNTAEWMEINIRCLRLMTKIPPGGLPVAAEIVISRPLMTDKNFVDHLCSSYSKIHPTPSCILLWVDEFAEHTAKINELMSWAHLIDRLGQIAPVVNMHGGYLSTILSKFTKINLRAVCHGPEYGETRAVIPVGGGIPVSKFYLPALHHRLSPAHAVGAIQALGAMNDRATFLLKVCNCAQCQAIITDDPEIDIKVYFNANAKSFWSGGRWITREFPTGEASDLCTKHYMYCKAAEFTESDDLKSVIAKLKSIHKELPESSDHISSHAVTWPAFLKKIGLD